ncbi:MAG: hypothetical protein R2699_13225 [Acidimicrobiales bacterium]|nr:hypothetical protein [Acidimicrobiales bacterium]MCB1251314.1 hypothetical protein [Acidimicrobiales bacterium]MCB1262977.1 hypothetical protein [Acidimicrobiales bacterium]
MHGRVFLVVALAACAGVGACSADSEPPAGGADGTQQPSASGTSSTTAPELAEGCVEQTTLTVVTDDGPVEVAMVTSYADIVGADTQSGTFTFSNTDISIDDARNVLQPSDLGEDEVVVVLSVQGAGEVTLGTYPPADEVESGPVVNFYAVYDHNGRLFGTPPSVELTHAGDGVVCGTLSGDSTEPGAVTGSFLAERIDTGTVRVR